MMCTRFRRTNKISYSKGFLFILILFFLSSDVYPQEISINCVDQPLNQVLITLRNTYDLMLSFDDQQLSSYTITVNKIFSNPSQAFDYLIKGLPLKYELTDGVYVFYTVQVKPKSKRYIVAGRILDKTNHESLPYSGILINGRGVISDASGKFSYTSAVDSNFSLTISYLGYYIIDTMVAPGTGYIFRMTPSVIALQEIIVEGSVVERSIQMGTAPGISKLNHKVAYYLPGNGDNSIFNLLRLQPGILASGEQSADFIIWGSYEGQSQVIFDGFTLYGMKNFNDNISAINPYMAKDIKVMKGGFGAEYGERVGGIVDITGSEGNRLSPSAQFSINNMTINGKLSIPFFKKSALVAAYRQTYYDLYKSLDISSSGFGRGKQSTMVDDIVDPDYLFRDMNVKFSGSGSKSNYYVSLYGGKDNFSYIFDKEYQQRTLSFDYNEGNIQFGGSAFYGMNWNKKNTSNFTVSYSSLEADRKKAEQIVRTTGNQVTTDINEQIESTISEINGRIENKIVLTEQQTLDIGAGLLYYYTDKLEESSYITQVDETSTLQLPYLYIQDNITLFKKLTLRPGIRTDLYSVSDKIYLQPRFSAVYRVTDHFKVNTAVGLYNQFVAKNMIIDTASNYRLAWSICDNSEIPVLKSGSYVVGLSYNKSKFAVSLEGYIRQTSGITRYLESSGITTAYEGDGNTLGLDFFVKKEFRNQTLWITYTLSQSREKFPYFPTNDYLPAIHDQRHEIKVAGLAKIKSFHFSANFVYGSGFPDPGLLPETVQYMQAYSRLDAAILYKFSNRKLHIDAGISVLNVLDKENIRYSNLIRIPAEDYGTTSLYADAVPFTPFIFLNIYY